MTKRFLMLFSAIAVSVAAYAANTVRVDLYQPTVVNGTTFKPGEAKLEIQGDKAVLRQGKVSAEASVKVENAKSKYNFTTIGYKEGNDHKIKDICVAGTTTRVLFEETSAGNN